MQILTFQAKRTENVTLFKQLKLARELVVCLLSAEMLQFRKQKSLAAQAMHELGNIMFHSGNIRYVPVCSCNSTVVLDWLEATQSRKQIKTSTTENSFYVTMRFYYQAARAYGGFTLRCVTLASVLSAVVT